MKRVIFQIQQPIFSSSFVFRYRVYLSDGSYNQTFIHTNKTSGHELTMTGLSPATGYTFHVVSYYDRFTLSDSIYSFSITTLSCTGKLYDSSYHCLNQFNFAFLLSL